MTPFVDDMTAILVSLSAFVAGGIMVLHSLYSVRRAGWLITGLAAMGVISQADADTVIGALIAIATAIGTIYGITLQVREYVYGRNAQKMAVLDLLKKRGE